MNQLKINPEDKFTIRMIATAVAWFATLMNPKAYGLDPMALDFFGKTIENAKMLGEVGSKFLVEETEKEAKNQDKDLPF